MSASVTLLPVLLSLLAQVPTSTPTEADPRPTIATDTPARSIDGSEVPTFRPAGEDALEATSPRREADADIRPSTAPASRFRPTPPEMIAAAIVPPSGHELTGRPAPLAILLEATTDRGRQLEIIRAYWRLFEAVAGYHFHVAHHQWLERAGARAPDDVRLRAKRVAAEADRGRAELAAVAAQHDLALAAGWSDAPGMAEQVPLPLPADRPHVGEYHTRFPQLFMRRLPQLAMRRIDRTLPLQFRAIDRQATAVHEAQDAFNAVEAENGETAFEYREMVLSAQLNWLAAVRRYNEDIAEYAVAVAEPGTKGLALVRMLIRPTSARLEPMVVSPTDRVAPAGHAEPTGRVAPQGRALDSPPIAVPRRLGVPTPAVRPAESPGQPTPAVRPSTDAGQVGADNAGQALADNPGRFRASGQPTPAVRPSGEPDASPTPNQPTPAVRPTMPGEPSGESSRETQDDLSEPTAESTGTDRDDTASEETWRAPGAAPRATIPPSLETIRADASREDDLRETPPPNAEDGPAEATTTILPMRPVVAVDHEEEIDPDVSSTTPATTDSEREQSSDSEADQSPESGLTPEPDAGLSPKPPADDQGGGRSSVDADARSTAHQARRPVPSSALYGGLVDASPAGQAKQLTATLHWDRQLPADTADPITLLECLRQCPADQRAGLIDAFWLTRLRAAEYQVWAQHRQWIEELAARPEGTSAGRRRVMAAGTAAEAAVDSAHARLVEAQAELAARLGREADRRWPIAGTTPHAGPYELRLESLPESARSVGPLRRSIDLLPRWSDQIKRRAASVIEADLARATRDEQALAGNADPCDVLRAINLQTHETLALLDALTRYNRTIGQYALLVLPPDVSAEELIGSLIVTPT